MIYLLILRTLGKVWALDLFLGDMVRYFPLFLALWAWVLFLLGDLLVRSLWAYYEGLWQRFQLQKYSWRHRPGGTSLMPALWAFYPYVLLLFLWFLYRWQALGRSWDGLPWLLWCLDWPLACWALMAPLCSLGLGPAGKVLELLGGWRGARLRWLESFQVYFLTWPPYRSLSRALHKLSYFLHFHGWSQGQDYPYRRRYLFRLILWPVSWDGPLRFLLPLLALGEMLLRGGRLQTFFYVLPCLALVLTVRKILRHLLVCFEKQDTSPAH